MAGRGEYRDWTVSLCRRIGDRIDDAVHRWREETRNVLPEISLLRSSSLKWICEVLTLRALTGRNGSRIPRRYRGSHQTEWTVGRGHSWNGASSSCRNVGQYGLGRQKRQIPQGALQEVFTQQLSWIPDGDVLDMKSFARMVTKTEPWKWPKMQSESR